MSVHLPLKMPVKMPDMHYRLQKEEQYSDPKVQEALSQWLEAAKKEYEEAMNIIFYFS